MKKAKAYDLQRIQRKKSCCIRKWFYFSHLNSWKNRAEKRLFFYWDRRLKRILFTWRTIVSKKYNNFEIIWEFRCHYLQSKAIKGLKLLKSIKIEDQLKVKTSQELCYKLRVKKIITVLKQYHEYSRKKLSKLTKALNYRYYRSCLKYFSSWENLIKQTRSKKAKTKKIINNYLRLYGLGKDALQNSSILSIKNLLNDDSYRYLNTFISSTKSNLPKHKNIYMISIFLK